MAYVHLDMDTRVSGVRAEAVGDGRSVRLAVGDVIAVVLSAREAAKLWRELADATTKEEVDRDGSRPGDGG